MYNIIERVIFLFNCANDVNLRHSTHPLVSLTAFIGCFKVGGIYFSDGVYQKITTHILTRLTMG